jgi:hypothetical protein
VAGPPGGKLSRMGETSAGRDQRLEPRALEATARELRTPAAAGVAGLVFAGLFAAAVVLLYQQPAKGSSAAQIAAWYTRGQARTLGLVGLYLVPFAGIAFLWFVAAVRHRIGAYEDRFFATVFLAGGIIFVALLYAAAAAAGAPLAAVRFQDAPPPSPDVVVFARGLGYTLLYVYAIRAAAVFMVVSSTSGLRTETLPRWLALFGYAVALVLLLSVSYARGFVLIFPLWVVLVSVELLRRARSERLVRDAQAR